MPTANQSLEVMKLALKVTALEERIVELKEDKQSLIAQLKHTQDALVAATSPQAYIDNKTMEVEAARTPEQLQEQERKRQIGELERKYLELSEQPLFKDAEDMQSTLSNAIYGSPSQDSLHENNES